IGEIISMLINFVKARSVGLLFSENPRGTLMRSQQAKRLELPDRSVG
ncbi:MAG: hypothetical protein RLZZ177_369, partial [Pseudomonadota bacterium]